ncbi:MAG: hypothetical protein AB7U66_04765 [Hyphomicrobiaceae bacterium]
MYLVISLVCLALLGTGFFFWGRRIARQKNRDPLLWGAVSALVPFVGISVLSALKSKRPPPRTRPVPSDSVTDIAPGGATPPAAIEDRWRFLTLYDPDVISAISEVAPLGPRAIQELRDAYFMTEDKRYLRLIVDRILQQGAGGGLGQPIASAHGQPRPDAALHQRPAGLGANGEQPPRPPHAARAPGPVIHHPSPPDARRPHAQPHAHHAPPAAAHPGHAMAPQQVAPPPQAYGRPDRPGNAEPPRQAPPPPDGRRAMPQHGANGAGNGMAMGRGPAQPQRARAPPPAQPHANVNGATPPVARAHPVQEAHPHGGARGRPAYAPQDVPETAPPRRMEEAVDAGAPPRRHHQPATHESVRPPRENSAAPPPGEDTPTDNRLQHAPDTRPFSAIFDSVGAVGEPGTAAARDRQASGAAPADTTAPKRSIPRHTTVTADDLPDARFIETYAGIHLFELRDGRVYVDKYLAVTSLEQARRAVDYIVSKR